MKKQNKRDTKAGRKLVMANARKNGTELAASQHRGYEKILRLLRRSL